MAATGGNVEEVVTSEDIQVGDIISERGIISERWNPEYRDMGAYMNEFTRFVVLSKINVEDSPMLITGARRFYFKVAILYAIPEIREVMNNAHTYKLTDWEVDDEDYSDEATYWCPQTGEDAPVTPREWVRLG